METCCRYARLDVSNNNLEIEKAQLLLHGNLGDVYTQYIQAHLSFEMEALALVVALHIPKAKDCQYANKTKVICSGCGATALVCSECAQRYFQLYFLILIFYCQTAKSLINVKHKHAART
jgi:hypothetical protein